MPDSIAAPARRAAIYARVSSDEQREGQTIDSQVAELERFARDKSWQVIGVYKDEGWSGSLLARPQLDRLRDEAARGLFDVVLLNDVDRLARDVTHLGIIKRDLERRGVNIAFRKLPSEQSPTSNLMINILGSFAEFEREMITDRTRRGRRYKVEVRGKFLGSQAVYGYRYTPKDRAAGSDGHLEVVPEEATVVRQMYRWVAEEGLSANRVMGRLNEQKIPARRGGRWAIATVINIMRNEMYAGIWYYNKYYACEPLNPKTGTVYRRLPKTSRRRRPRSEWLPVRLQPELIVVERDLWQRAQEQLRRNQTYSPRNVKHLYLLRSLIKCGSCSASYVGTPSHDYYYYRCFGRCKKLGRVSAPEIDGMVWSAVKEALLKPQLLLEQLGKHQVRVRSEKNQLQSEAREIEVALEGARKEETRIIGAYREAIITPAQLGEELEKIKVRVTALEARRDQLSLEGATMVAANLRRSALDYCRNVAARLKTMSMEERQRLLRLLLDKVIYEGNQIRIKGIIPLESDESESTVNKIWPEEGTTLEAVRSNVTTTSRSYEHNVYIRNQENLLTDGHIIQSHLRFELTKAMPVKRFSVLSTEGLALVQRLVSTRLDPTLRELCEQVLAERGVEVGVHQMCRALKRLGLSRIKRGRRPKARVRMVEVS